MILLDTHAWVWFLSDPKRLSSEARTAIAEAQRRNAVYVSSISAWEVARLVARGRLALSVGIEEWMARVESLPFFTYVPVDNAIAVASVQLPGPLHDDPADRILMATALRLGVPLVTKDERIRGYAHLRTIW